MKGSCQMMLNVPFLVCEKYLMPTRKISTETLKT